MSQQINMNKLYWQSRRGMWELDLILVPFLKNTFVNLTQSQKELYIEMLSEEDQDLFLWLVKKNLDHCEKYKDLVQVVIESNKKNNERPH